MESELKPRLCSMIKGENGYGFHLHGEKGKSGQYIRKVEPDSPAEAAGLRAGDRVVEVNGENVEKETHHQVVQRIKALEHETRLLVVDRDTDEYLRSLRLACTEDMAVQEKAESPASASPAASPAASPVASPVASPATPSKRENGSISKPPRSSSLVGAKPSKRSPSRAGKKEKKAQPPPEPEPEPESPDQVEREVEREVEQVTELFPRLCRLVRAETGYGFNLHSEKARPGQYIRSLDPGSPADHAGLRPQDRLVEVNGVNIESLRHSEVVAFIKSGGEETRLLVVDPDTDDHFKKLGIVPTESHIKDYESQPVTNGSSELQVNGSSTSQSTRSTHSAHSELSTPETSMQVSEENECPLLDPFEESGLQLSPTAAEAKEKAHAKRARKRAPQMDWNKKHQLFSNF
ncbi:Na(+)/H(+) exchange regulatory cofactor NHE-RF2 [Anguilla anguilla]|uniref:Na(+)/H(+) exchange regulatory cofactor NHE-RF2 n=1 Tax=Anguilla anguilla TaxID=7936 RepID=UPI0015AAD9E3|nr:Na(+)/H(+) exchange regulatory cofactor NHE-RF2 [Anguilla anguilla]